MTHIDDEIRRITIDINQAGNYYADHKFDGFEKNLEDVIGKLQELIVEVREAHA